jgi:pentose-5-phosphate-3-epimerase
LKRAPRIAVLLMVGALVGHLTDPSAHAWFDETHIAVAKVAGYSKWFNACGPDMIKVKMGDRERHNHYVNNPRGTVVTPEMVMAQVGKYDQIDECGHLYGAIIASVREYVKEKKEGKYGEYHMAFCAHYVADLSQPLHNTEYNLFNEMHHKEVDGTVNDEVLESLDKIKIYPIKITSEEDLANEIARVANLSMVLGYRLEDENRLLTKKEAYQQLGHSASLFKAVFEYAKKLTEI